MVIHKDLLFLVAVKKAGDYNGMEAYIYNITTKKITQLPDLKIQIDQTSAVIKDNILYTIGGCNSYEQTRWDEYGYCPVKRAQMLNLNSPQEWIEIASLNQEKYDLTAVVNNDYIYAIGGEIFCMTGCTDSIEQYDNEKWTILQIKAPAPARGIAAIGNPLIIFGGAGKLKNRTTFYSNKGVKIEGNEIKQFTGPFGLSTYSSTKCANTMYMVGYGYESGKQYYKMLKVDIKTMEVTEVALPE